MVIDALIRRSGDKVVSLLQPLIRRRGTISAAVALVSLYMFSLRIIYGPRNLQHIVHANSLPTILAILQRKSASERTAMQMPLSLQTMNGVYLSFTEAGWVVTISRPEAAKQFLLNLDVFPKELNSGIGPKTLMAKFFFGPNVVALNGPHWKAQRMTANPAFHRSMPVELFAKLTKKLMAVMDTDMEQQGFVNFREMTERWTLDAIGLAGFDFDFKSVTEKNNDWVQRYEGLMAGAMKPLFLIFQAFDQSLRFLFPNRVQEHKELDIFLEMVDQVIAKKRKAIKDQIGNPNIKDNEKDLLTMMLEAEDEHGHGMTDEELRSNICIFFIAGHETTANALAFAVCEMALHQDLQERARKEVIDVLGDAPEDIAPTVEQTRKLPFLEMFIKENLRKNNPVGTMMIRVAQQDTDLNGTFIPKGTRIVLNIDALHHNPTVWKDPYTFNVERFAPGGENEKVARLGMSWIPFSNGARQCLGMNFSLAEQRVFLSMLLRRYEWHLPDDTIHRKNDIKTTGAALISPKDLRIVFKKRF
ncbi:cytochrome P450 [Dichotomocladium elegans]|nr:cytochrome P450 [Dichotomocladium elegans]